MRSLASFLKAKAKGLTDFVRQDSMRILGIEAKKHFQESFHNQGFTDKALQPWKDVKRRKESRKRLNKDGSVAKSQPASLTSPILVVTKTLRDSIDYKVSPNMVEVGTDDEKGKAEAHNEGTTTAGRGNRTTIPQRQFMGESRELRRKVRKIYAEKVKQILLKS